MKLFTFDGFFVLNIVKQNSQFKKIKNKKSFLQFLTENLDFKITIQIFQTVKLESINESGITEIASSRDARKFIHVELSKQEFAEYMNLKPTSSFVEQMFTVADVDHSGAISFREFLDIMVLFTKGIESRLM